MKRRETVVAVLAVVVLAACGGGSEESSASTETTNVVEAPRHTAAQPTPRPSSPPANDFTRAEFDELFEVCRERSTDPGFQVEEESSKVRILASFEQIPPERLDAVVRPAIQKLVNGGENFELTDGSGGTISAEALCNVLLYQEAGPYLS